MVQGNTNICSESSNGTTCKTATSVIGWPATEGYDYGTGLGSVNAYNLATQWSTVTFNSSATTMSLTASGITHGTSVPVTVNVTGNAGTPTGDVGFILSSGSLGDPINTTSSDFTEEVTLTRQNAFGTLSGGTYSGNINSLPGGSYNVYARYAGDANFGSSTSTLIPVTVLPKAAHSLWVPARVQRFPVCHHCSHDFHLRPVCLGRCHTEGRVWNWSAHRYRDHFGHVTTPHDPSASERCPELHRSGFPGGWISRRFDSDLVIYQNINAFVGGSHSLTATY